MTKEAADRKKNIIVGGYLLLFAVLAASIAIVQQTQDIYPIFPNPPDEHARILIPRFIAAHGKLPTGFEEEVQIPGYGSSYAFQPGLPYIVMGIMMRIAAFFGAEGFALTLTARLVNVCTGVFNAYLLYLLGQRLFTHEAQVYLFAIGCTFHPQHLFIYTYVNTDALCMASISMMGLALVAILQDGMSRKRCLLFAAGQICCALTYYNAYGFLLCGATMFALFFVHRDAFGRPFVDWRGVRTYLIPTALLIFAGAGWWFLRNLIMLDGDIFGLSTTFRLQQEHGAIKFPPITQGMGILQMLAACREPMFTSFVATYGSMSIPGTPLFYLPYRLLFTLGFVSFAVWYVKNRKMLTAKARTLHVMTLFACLITALLWAYYCYAIDFQPQGRYVLPIIAPFYYVVVTGLEKVFLFCGRRFRKEAVFAALPCVLTVGLILLCVWFVYGMAFPVYLTAEQI